ncbi:MAG: RNA repair domain-containing protein [Candidatus Thermoplasmatota archaeon]
MTPRDVLNKIKWGGGDLKKAEIWYIHRGVPGNYKIVNGSEILKIEKGFFILENASIPYHRIIKIIYDGEVIFERR